MGSANLPPLKIEIDPAALAKMGEAVMKAQAAFANLKLPEFPRCFDTGHSHPVMYGVDPAVPGSDMTAITCWSRKAGKNTLAALAALTYLYPAWVRGLASQCMEEEEERVRRDLARRFGLDLNFWVAHPHPAKGWKRLAKAARRHTRRQARRDRNRIFFTHGKHGLKRPRGKRKVSGWKG